MRHDRGVAEPSQRRQVGVVVVEVADEHGVDVVDVAVHGHVAAAAQHPQP